MIPGTTHAVESIANIRGWSALRQAAPDRHVRRRRDRAAAQALDEPRHDQHLHRRREPADQQPAGEQHEAHGERPVERLAVERRARQHGPDEVAQEERRVDPAVELEVAQLLRDDRHDRADGQRLEGDEGDRRDEPDRQPAQTGREQVGGPCLDGGARGHGHGADCARGGRRGPTRTAGEPAVSTTVDRHPRELHRDGPAGHDQPDRVRADVEQRLPRHEAGQLAAPGARPRSASRRSAHPPRRRPACPSPAGGTRTPRPGGSTARAPRPRATPRTPCRPGAA